MSVITVYFFNLSFPQPNDMYEQEADAMADKVMRMSDAAASNNLFFKPSLSSLQRKCAYCEEEEKQMQLKEAAMMKLFLQHKQKITTV